MNVASIKMYSTLQVLSAAGWCSRFDFSAWLCGVTGRGCTDLMAGGTSDSANLLPRIQSKFRILCYFFDSTFEDSFLQFMLVSSDCDPWVNSRLEMLCRDSVSYIGENSFMYVSHLMCRHKHILSSACLRSKIATNSKSVRIFTCRRVTT